MYELKSVNAVSLEAVSNMEKGKDKGLLYFKPIHNCGRVAVNFPKCAKFIQVDKLTDSI